MRLIHSTIFTLFFLCLLTGCKDKQATQSVVVTKTPKTTIVETTTPREEKKTILCFGNSLTAGYGLDENQAWPALLQARLDSLNEPYIVVNAGLSGETTSGGLNRLDWVIKQHVDLFILELGANDMLKGLAVDNTKENLDNIIIRVSAKYPDAKIIIAGMLAPPNMGDDYAKDFNRIYSDLAMKHKAAIIPFILDEVAGKKDLNLPDGKHPNIEGQKILLENVWAALQPLI